MLAELGLLRDEAQALEVGIGARGHRDQRLAARAVALHPGLGAGDRQRARRLEHHARVLEHVLDRRAHRVGIGEHHLVDELAAQAKRLAADLLHRHPVGKESHVFQRHAPFGLQGSGHRVRVDRLNPHHPDRRTHALDVGRNAGDQAAAAHRDEDGVERPGMLAQDLHADRALPGDHFRVVVGMNEGKAAAALEAHRLRKRLGVRIAVQHDLRAARQHRVDLDARRGHGHHDHRPAAEALRGEGDPLRVIAGARRDHAPGEARTRQPGHLVVGAAQLEREYRLQVLALDEQAVAQAPGQPGRELERRFARHVVDASLEDPLEIVVVLHAAPWNGRI